ncbi:MAG: transcriptional regulator PpsR [Beijerinckiaceae bacterium]
MRSADHAATAEPDITLVLDLEGVIEKATLSPAVSDEKIDNWIGRHWSEVVGVAAGDKVHRIVEDARTTGVSAFRQINQIFPSGLELPFEFTAVRLENQRSLVAIGKNLKAVAELQSRLIAAQQLMERDYWRLREAENRYRQLFDASTEPVLLIAAASLQIVEANPSAVRAFDLQTGRRGRVLERSLMSLADERDHAALSVMFDRVRDLGRTPGIIVRLGEIPWIVRASLTGADSASEFILQFSPARAVEQEAGQEQVVPLEALIERSPDGIVIADRNGAIRRLNRAFLELVGANARGALLGEPLSRWLAQPGADAGTLLLNVSRHGYVRLLPTILTGARGMERRVEVSAAGDSESDPQYVCFVIRDVERRLPARAAAGDIADELRTIADRIGKAPLRLVVQETIDSVERHHIRAALEASGGNRTEAAEMLGLSRQGLYAKLKRYGLALEP